MDMYLSFENEAAARAVLYRIEGAVEADPERGVEAREGYKVANYANIDTIGVIYKRTGGTDEEPVMEPLPGWHVNVRVVENEDAVALKPFEVQVKTPIRVWG